MAATHRLGEHVEVPPAEARRRTDSYRLEWHPSSEVVKRALFRVDGGEAVLQHVRTVRVAQGDTSSSVDDGAALTDVPTPLLVLMRGHGVDPVDGGGGT